MRISPLTVFRFKSVLFGATSSPFMLNMSIQDILSHNNFGHMLEVFVDNLFIKCNSENVIVSAAEEAVKTFGKFSMPLHELACNVPAINAKFKENKLLTESKSLKTLGLMWDFHKDLWSINIPEFIVDKATKRTVLSDIARIFDPLGFISPISILGRILVQECWDAAFRWDAILPSGMQDTWRGIADRLLVALKIPTPRWTGFSSYEDVSIHCFTDASGKAMGTVVYLVSGSQSCNLMAKAKTCPLNMAHFTIPRKELTAYALGGRLLVFVINSVSKYFSPSSVHLWSDASTVLGWCASKVDHKEVYIRNRVDEIKSKIGTFNIKQHHILGSDNTADALTKDTGLSLNDPLWLYGPEVLRHPEQWKEFVPSKGFQDSIPVFCGMLAEEGLIKDLPDPCKFDSAVKLFNETAKIMFSNSDSGINFNKARNLWFKSVQKYHYTEELKFLRIMQGHHCKSIEGKILSRSNKLQTPPLCLNFHLILDDEDVIRIKTSQFNANNLPFDTRCPILLPKDDKFTSLIVKDAHFQCGHFGLNATRSYLRANFWIPKVASLVKNIINSCKICSEERVQRYHVPDSPPIPDFRFDFDKPFNCTCLDMTGNYNIKVKDEVFKYYLVIFVCAATGCGHVEVVADATSISFTNAFERFVSRRGCPSIVISDQGSNFKGSYTNELRQMSEHLIVKNNLKSKGIKWLWTPIGDPHFNGLVERQLGIIKKVIKKTVGQKLLSLDEFTTVVAYAECLFNERPLCELVNDPDYLLITTNLLVYGHSHRHFNHSLSNLD